MNRPPQKSTGQQLRDELQSWRSFMLQHKGFSLAWASSCGATLFLFALVSSIAVFAARPGVDAPKPSESLTNIANSVGIAVEKAGGPTSPLQAEARKDGQNLLASARNPFDILHPPVGTEDIDSAVNGLSDTDADLKNKLLALKKRIVDYNAHRALAASMSAAQHQEFVRSLTPLIQRAKDLETKSTDLTDRMNAFAELKKLFPAILAERKTLDPKVIAAVNEIRSRLNINSDDTGPGSDPALEHIGTELAPLAEKTVQGVFDRGLASGTSTFGDVEDIQTLAAALDHEQQVMENTHAQLSTLLNSFRAIGSDTVTHALDPKKADIGETFEDRLNYPRRDLSRMAVDFNDATWDDVLKRTARLLIPKVLALSTRNSPDLYQDEVEKVFHEMIPPSFTKEDKARIYRLLGSQVDENTYITIHEDLTFTLKKR